MTSPTHSGTATTIFLFTAFSMGIDNGTANNRASERPTRAEAEQSLLTVQ